MCMSQRSLRFMPQLQYITAEKHFLETRLDIFWHRLNVIHFCLWLHSFKGSSKINRGASGQRMYVFKSLFCLSASVCEPSNLFVWTHSWRDVRTVLTETNREASAHIVHSAHILLIQFWEIALPQKRLSLFCHSASQVTFTANNLTG